ncbi:hypothetical protein K1T71_001077 [Dendrolimus kikuchii]|uniref:Uncharacterized protein n=1 Tax=Dendrolimus kikuchii TaxID=765133 RepID=A0ACC1DGT1_9NEOP|nr:hypothetical protein K1T71_001077 [Dendrolimus kikuchii]
MALPCEMLLHPELLTNEQLMHIIQERHLCIPHIECLPRDELLDLFHHYCVPYGQRKYRDSGRGKLLNKTRHISPERITKLNVMNYSKMQSRKSQSSCERIKPPPDILSGHMKRIKIESNCPVFTKELNTINVNKRKISVDNQSQPMECPPVKKERKLITWP